MGKYSWLMRRLMGNCNVWMSFLARQWEDLEEDSINYTSCLRISLLHYKSEKRKIKKRNFIKLNIHRCSIRSKLEAQLLTKCIIPPHNFLINLKLLKMSSFIHKNSKEQSKLSMSNKEQASMITQSHNMFQVKVQKAKSHIPVRHIQS